jgi:hypothetical protein
MVVNDFYQLKELDDGQRLIEVTTQGQKVRAVAHEAEALGISANF